MLLRVGGIRTNGLEAQSDFLIRCEGSDITTFDGFNGSDGGNVKELRNTAIRIQLGWCKLGSNLIHLLPLDFLWVLQPGNAIFDSIMPNLLLVTIIACNLMELVIVVMVDCSACVSDVAKAVADCCPSLVSG